MLRVIGALNGDRTHVPRMSNPSALPLSSTSAYVQKTRKEQLRRS